MYILYASIYTYSNNAIGNNFIGPTSSFPRSALLQSWSLVQFFPKNLFNIARSARKEEHCFKR